MSKLILATLLITTATLSSAITYKIAEKGFNYRLEKETAKILLDRGMYAKNVGMASCIEGATATVEMFMTKKFDEGFSCESIVADYMVVFNNGGDSKNER